MTQHAWKKFPQLTPFSFPESIEAYTVGRRFDIKANEANPITEKLGSMTLYVEIIKHLSVGCGRRSQVLIVRLRNTLLGGLDDTFVAKCYDPRFCPRLDTREWPGGRE